MSKKKNGAPEAPVVAAALALQEAVEEIERLTVRGGKLELSTRNEILRAGELLQKAAEAHRAFLGHLGELTQAVGGLRDRQNASAAQLSEQAQRLDDRRKEHEAMELRFAELGEAAREVGETMKAHGEPGDASAAAVKAGLIAAKERLAAAVESARVLSQDAKAASFPELDAQAHAIRQQLSALLRKIDELG